MKKAFTLIELLVVIAIIAVLMGILMPALNSARKGARRTVCSAHMHDLGLAITMYCEQEEGLLPAMIVGQGGEVRNEQLTNHQAVIDASTASDGKDYEALHSVLRLLR
ncbi:MAG: prepilin-type N-terminal cleavage/methylation domain-containing protein [Planctomycetes bacterium]|nr:prepilin-type N-terminal cleavage/methylation domain-containing protein [Planctomycetota bacterium]